MPDKKRAVAQFKALVKNLPEFFCIAAGRAGNVNKINCDDSLIETSVEFRLVCFRIAVYSQERTASHARIAVSFLKFKHFLFRNVVWNKTSRGAFCSKFRKVVKASAFGDVVRLKNVDEFRERRGYPEAFFVLYALIALFQDFFYNHGKVCFFLFVLCFVKIHKYSYERTLTVCGHKRNYLILYCLYAARNFFCKALVYDIVKLFLRVGDSCKARSFFCFPLDFLSAYVYKRCKV